MKTVLTLAASLAMTAFTAPLAAQETNTVAVRVGDLNLGSAAGMRAVEARIDAAARRVCGETVGVRDRAFMRIYENCRIGAVTAAMGAVQARNTALYAPR